MGRRWRLQVRQCQVVSCCDGKPRRISWVLTGTPHAFIPAAPPNATNASVSLLLAVCAATDVPLLLNSSSIDQKAFASCVAGANLTTTSTTSTDAAGLANATETLLQECVLCVDLFKENSLSIR